MRSVPSRRPEPVRALPVIRSSRTSATARGVALGQARARRFTDGLIAALPGLHEHGCSYGEPGGFIRRLTEDEGTWLGHILEHVAIELQNVAGEPVTFGKTRGAGAAGHYHVVYQYEQEDVGLEAGRLGLDAAALAAAARAPARRRGAGGLRLRRRAGRVHPLRAAPGPGAEHDVAGARGRGAAASRGSGSTTRA